MAQDKGSSTGEAKIWSGMMIGSWGLISLCKHARPQDVHLLYFIILAFSIAAWE